jgi:hypothetical protein
MFRDFEIAYPVFSEHIEERNIRDATGRIFGTDPLGLSAERAAMEIRQVFHWRRRGV